MALDILGASTGVLDEWMNGRMDVQCTDTYALLAIDIKNQNKLV
jgi:hypothetical protein